MIRFNDYRKQKLQNFIGRTSVLEGVDRHFDILRLNLLDAAEIPQTLSEGYDPRLSSLLDKISDSDNDRNRVIIDYCINEAKGYFHGCMYQEAVDLGAIDRDTGHLQGAEKLKAKVVRAVSDYLDDFKNNTLAHLIGSTQGTSSAQAAPQAGQPQQPTGPAGPPQHPQAQPQQQPYQPVYQPPQGQSGAPQPQPQAGGSSTPPWYRRKAKSGLGKVLWNIPASAARGAYGWLKKAYNGDYLDHQTYNNLLSMMENVYFETTVDVATEFDRMKSELMKYITASLDEYISSLAATNGSPQASPTPVAGTTPASTPAGTPAPGTTPALTPASTPGAGTTPAPQSLPMQPRQPGQPPAPISNPASLGDPNAAGRSTTPPVPGGRGGRAGGISFNQQKAEDAVRQGNTVTPAWLNQLAQAHGVQGIDSANGRGTIQVYNDIRRKLDANLSDVESMQRKGVTDGDIKKVMKNQKLEWFQARNPAFLSRVAASLNIKIQSRFGKGDPEKKPAYFRDIVAPAIHRRLQEPGISDQLAKGIRPQPVINASDLTGTEPPPEGEAVPPVLGGNDPAVTNPADTTAAADPAVTTPPGDPAVPSAEEKPYEDPVMALLNRKGPEATPAASSTLEVPPTRAPGEPMASTTPPAAPRPAVTTPPAGAPMRAGLGGRVGGNKPTVPTATTTPAAPDATVQAPLTPELKAGAKTLADKRNTEWEFFDRNGLKNTLKVTPEQVEAGIQDALSKDLLVGSREFQQSVNNYISNLLGVFSHFAKANGGDETVVKKTAKDLAQKMRSEGGATTSPAVAPEAPRTEPVAPEVPAAAPEQAPETETPNQDEEAAQRLKAMNDQIEILRKGGIELPSVTPEDIESFIEPGKPTNWDDVEDKIADAMAGRYAQDKGITDISQARQALVDAYAKGSGEVPETPTAEPAPEVVPEAPQPSQVAPEAPQAGPGPEATPETPQAPEAAPEEHPLDNGTDAAREELMKAAKTLNPRQLNGKRPEQIADELSASFADDPNKLQSIIGNDPKMATSKLSDWIIAKQKGQVEHAQIYKMIPASVMSVAMNGGMTREQIMQEIENTADPLLQQGYQPAEIAESIAENLFQKKKKHSSKRSLRN